MPFLDHQTTMAISELLPVKLTVFLKGAQFCKGSKLYATPDLFQKAMSSRGLTACLSFLTRFLIEGTFTSHISDALGHSSGAVTAHYLKTLPDEQYRKIGLSLLEFK